MSENKNRKQTLQEMLDMIEQFKGNSKIIPPQSTDGKWKIYQGLHTKRPTTNVIGLFAFGGRNSIL